MTKQFTAILLLTLSLLTACGNGGEVETLTQERDALQGQVSELNAQMNTLGTERDELLTRVETVEGERDELQGQVEELGTQVTTVEAERDELQARTEVLAEELEQAQQEVLNLNIERDEILAGIQEEFAVQIVDLHNDLQEIADILVVVEQERNELRERLGEGVLPPLDSPEDAGEGTSTPQQGLQSGVEEPAPPTIEINPGTVKVDTSRQTSKFRERIEQIKSQVNQP